MQNDQYACLLFFQELQFEKGRGQTTSTLFKLQTKYSTLSAHKQIFFFFFLGEIPDNESKTDNSTEYERIVSYDFCR